ncbi:hypothetical protein [Burkholderia sp. A9]|uniref:hypothetical protein n=1 Tax=Burkholderia sp. A9 TaxID=1365108 RepID=UPI001379172B|nr:hypothetical protein [Burkholderia sp. A9]
MKLAMVGRSSVLAAFGVAWRFVRRKSDELQITRERQSELVLIDGDALSAKSAGSLARQGARRAADPQSP